MKRTHFNEEQIITILKEQEVGIPVSELCRKHGVRDASIDKWKAKYGGMNVSEAKRLKALEEENGKLKRMLADARGVCVNFQPTSGSGAAQYEKLSASTRRFTRPRGQNQRRKRTQNWIKIGGNVNQRPHSTLT